VGVKVDGVVVELEPGCWIAPWSGDPGRTTVKRKARVYKSWRGARIALGLARKYRPFKNAAIRPIFHIEKDDSH